MLELFQKIPVDPQKPADYIRKQQMLLIDIGGKWFMEKHKSKFSLMRRPKLIKEERKREDNIKQNL